MILTLFNSSYWLTYWLTGPLSEFIHSLSTDVTRASTFNTPSRWWEMGPWRLMVAWQLDTSFPFPGRKWRVDLWPKHWESMRRIYFPSIAFSCLLELRVGVCHWSLWELLFLSNRSCPWMSDKSNTEDYNDSEATYFCEYDITGVVWSGKSCKYEVRR